jgi:hypothetical protein
MRHMVVIVPELTGYASIRHVAVSLPYASQLIDHVKYMEPQDVKPPGGDSERRRQRAPRAPSMRYLVKLAVKCRSAEELGKRLRRRYQRQQLRRGLASGSTTADAGTRLPSGSIGWRRIEADDNRLGGMVLALHRSLPAWRRAIDRAGMSPAASMAQLPSRLPRSGHQPA